MANDQAIMLDGLGPVGGKYHTAEEYIEADSLRTRIDALTQFVTHLDE